MVTRCGSGDEGSDFAEQWVMETDRKSPSRPSAPVAALVTWCCAHHAAADPGTADFLNDPVEYWAARLLTWALVSGALLAAFGLTRAAAGRLRGTTGKAFMLVSVVLLPSFAVATGMLLVFTRATRVEF